MNTDDKPKFSEISEGIFSNMYEKVFELAEGILPNVYEEKTVEEELLELRSDDEYPDKDDEDPDEKEEEEEEDEEDEDVK